MKSICISSWCDAAYKCGTPCPNANECTNGESCFADIPCDSDSPKTPPSLPAPPTAAPYQFCGSSISNAKDHCWQPCPRGNSDCCLGLSCFDTSENNAGDMCTDSDYSGTNHYFCGSSWCQAAYSCLTVSPLEVLLRLGCNVVVNLHDNLSPFVHRRRVLED